MKIQLTLSFITFSFDLRTSQNALAVVKFIMTSIMEMILFDCQTPLCPKPDVSILTLEELIK